MKKIFLVLCTVLLGCSLIAAQVLQSIDDCVDGVCVIPEQDDDGKQVYAVVSPVGYNAVEMIEQASRLNNLDGKNIALVGGSFMASVTHAEIKKCILIGLINFKYTSCTISSCRLRPVCLFIATCPLPSGEKHIQ